MPVLRRLIRHPRSLLALAAAVVAVLAAVADAGAAEPRPNVLVIVTDDQNRGTITPEVMPQMYRRLVLEGRSYPGFFVADPLCCPSRATIMTGRYNHNNGVVGNGHDALALDHDTTAQRYLRRAGYRTGLFGKFFNGWPVHRDPPHLDSFAIARGSRHVGATFNTDGVTAAVPGWADDYILERALAFAAQPDPKPWYMYVAPTTPHSPYTPRPEDAASPLPALLDPPVEADLFDKHPAMAANQVPAGETAARRRAELRLLMGLDRVLGALFDGLERDGVLDDTLVLYMSDNGFLHGEHGLSGKRLPYTEATNVPLHVRWPGAAAAGSVDTRLVSNVDVLPTVLSAAGVDGRVAERLDGRDLLDDRWRRRVILHESWQSNDTWQPAFASLRRRTWQFIEYHDGRGAVSFREYYDLRADPLQHENLLADGDRRNDPDVRELHRRLEHARACAGGDCP